MAKLLPMPESPVLSDANVRLQALDIQRSWIVEAPAGSGKTGLLIQRYLCLLDDAAVTEPEQVLAITFTKAATAEIRERVVRELQRAHDAVEAVSEYDRATRKLAEAVLRRDEMLGWRLLEEPHRLRVRTIDSVNAEIARSLPILSGAGSLLPLEDPSQLYREAARHTWLHLGGDHPALSAALRELLLHRDGDLESCESLIAEMLADREQWSPLIPVHDADLTDAALDVAIRKQLDETLDEVICEALCRLAHAFPEPALRQLTSFAASLSDRSGYRDQPSPFAICRDLHGPLLPVADHLPYWRVLIHLLLTPSSGGWRNSLNGNYLRVNLTEKEKLALRELSDSLQGHPDLLERLNEIVHLPPVRFPSEQWPITKALLRVLRQALLELQAVFAETSRCDFAEPALLASRAFSQRNEFGKSQVSLGTELKHLLVDEMQDTSVRQYQLLEHLTENWASERKTVFLVGDPKQSIYLFRHARVERFIETMRTGRLGTVPVDLLQLTANFRSQAGLISAFNQDFGRVFPQTISRPEDVNYVRGTATRRKSPGLAGEAGAAWHLSIVDEGPRVRTETDRQHRVDAVRIRRIAEAWRSRPLPAGRTAPWKIAILVQSRASLGRVLPELRREPALPLRTVKIDSLNKRAEVLDLVALTRALLHPGDRTAWLAVLHAPWCGLGLSDLHLLTGSDDVRSLNRSIMSLVLDRATELSVDGMRRLERVWPVLEAGMRASGRIPLPECVERTWRTLGGHTFLSHAAQRNAESFLHLLRTIHSESGEVRFSELTRGLEHLYASSDGEDGALELTTIHQAKGLEWDVVLVPELNRRSPAGRPRLFEMEELLSGKVLLAPIQAKGSEAASLNRWLRRVRTGREAAERKRLFYVACTRAREELHLFGVATRRSASEIKPESASLLQAAWPAAEARLPAQTTLLFPSSPEADPVFDIAAGSDEENAPSRPSAPVLERLPLEALPALRCTTRDLAEAANSQLSFEASKASFSARSFGTVVHTFLEAAANRLSKGGSATQLKDEISAWGPRIRAVLRGNGLAPQVVQRLTPAVLDALRTTLSDPVGQWVLSANADAQSELALVTATNGKSRQHRIDRVFRAGPAPGMTGNDYLWIVDYKTSAYTASLYDAEALQEFVTRERTLHAKQLERYACLLNEDRVRVGLWFPILGKLAWWEPSSPEEVAAETTSA